MTIKKAVLSNIALVLSGIGGVSPALAQKPATKAPAISPIVRVADVFGTVEKRNGNGAYTRMTTGQTVATGATIRTSDNSAVLLELPAHAATKRHAYLRIGAKSVVLFNEVGQTGTYDCKVVSGQAWGVVHPKGASTTFSISTPSARTDSTGGVWGVGYELESDVSRVSVDAGTVLVRTVPESWRGNATAGQSVHYLRRPQPNIRLRAPEAVPQSPEEKAMWTLLRTESWTLANPRPNAKLFLRRGNETKLRVLVGSPQVIEGSR